jgi:hypothetical protein
MWEASKHGAAYLAVNARESQRRIEDVLGGTLDRRHERGPKSWPSLVIPRARFEKMGLSTWTKREASVHAPLCSFRLT